MSLDAATRAAIISGSATLLSILAGLLGVYGNLAWNRKKHQDDKSYNLRRDVYLESVGVMNRAVAFLVGQTVPTDDEKKEDEDVSAELVGVCAKLHILGEKRVVASAIAFESLFLEWSNKLIAHTKTYKDAGKRGEDVRTQIKELGETVEAAVAERHDAMRILKEFDPNGHGEVLKQAQEAAKSWKELPGRFAQIQKDLDSVGEKQAVITAERYQKLATTIDYILSVSATFEPILTEITLAMKTELGLRTDDAWYKSEMKKALEDSRRSTAQLFENTAEIKQLRDRIAQTVPETKG